MNPRTSAIPVALALLLLATAASLAGCTASSGQATPVDVAASQVDAGTGAPGAASGTGRATIPPTGPKSTDSASRYEAFRLTVSCDEFMAAQDPATGTASLGQTVRLQPDGEVTLTLCSNASTGFSWEAPRYDPAALALVSHVTQPPEGSAPGAAGSETWVFRALGCAATGSSACGTSDVAFTYSQPWAGGTKGAWTFTLTVETVQVPVIEQEPPGPSEPGMR